MYLLSWLEGHGSGTNRARIREFLVDVLEKFWRREFRHRTAAAATAAPANDCNQRREKGSPPWHRETDCGQEATSTPHAELEEKDASERLDSLLGSGKEIVAQIKFR